MSIETGSKGMLGKVKKYVDKKSDEISKSIPDQVESEINKVVPPMISESTEGIVEDVNNSLKEKQDKLTAGDNITITGNKISSSGGLNRDVPIVRYFDWSGAVITIRLEGNTVNSFEVICNNSFHFEGKYQSWNSMTEYVVDLSTVSPLGNYVSIHKIGSGLILWLYRLNLSISDWNITNQYYPGFIRNKPTFKTLNGQSIIGKGDISIGAAAPVSQVNHIVNVSDVGKETLYSLLMDDLTFSIEKQSNTQWAVFIQNNGAAEITVAYNFAHFYSNTTVSQEGGNVQTSKIVLTSGQKSSALESDTAYLGYGNAMLSTVNHQIAVIKDGDQSLYEMTSIMNKSAGVGIISYINKIV